MSYTLPAGKYMKKSELQPSNSVITRSDTKLHHLVINNKCWRFNWWFWSLPKLGLGFSIFDPSVENKIRCKWRHKNIVLQDSTHSQRAAQTTAEIQFILTFSVVVSSKSICQFIPKSSRNHPSWIWVVLLSTRIFQLEQVSSS